MKTFKLVVGILSIILFLFIAFQSCGTNLVNAIDNNTSDTSGGAGMLVAIVFLICGITLIAGRSSKVASIVCGVLFLLGALIAGANLGTFSDLVVWMVLSIILGVIFLIGGIVQKRGV